MSGSFEARMVRVEFETAASGRIYATSPDLRGLLVSERTMPALEALLPQAIADMFAACGEAVVVSRLTGEPLEGEAWVAFPAEVARQLLTDDARRLLPAS